MNEFWNMYMSKIYRISSNTMNKKKLKNNYINKGNVSSLMKIVKTADDSYVGLLRLSQHKHNFINGKLSTYQKKHQTICRWWS